MLALTLAPAEIWRHPTDDGIYKGFDPNLIYTRAGDGGLVGVSPDSIDMAAGPDTESSANLATTLMPNLEVSVFVVILANPIGAEPMRVGAWSPWSESGHVVVFGPGPQNLITAETIGSEGRGPTLSGGKVVASVVLGHYQLGSTYNVTLVVDRSAGRISSFVSGGNGVRAEASMDRRQSPILFGNVQLSIDASAIGNQLPTHATLTHFVVTVPHQRWWASLIADPRAQAIQAVLVIAGILLLGLAIVGRFRSGSASLLASKARSIADSWWGRIRSDKRVVIGIVGGVGLYLVGNAWLFQFGGHPFDMAYEKLYAYVARSYAPADLYTLLNTKSLAGLWAGSPIIEASFPYGPVVAYLFAGIGWLNSLLFAGGGGFSPDSRSVEYVIKAVNVLFGLADAALIYGILRLIGATRRWSLIPAALFLFNPAVWFSMSVWGQTHVMSLFFVLAAVWFAEKHLPMWAWLALAAALLTRPQMIVFGLVLGLVFVRKFSWRENVSALSWAVVLTFLALLPLTLATSPSLPVDVMLHNFRIQEAGGNGTALSPVSNGGLSIWPLVTYLAHGASGISRTFAANTDYVVDHVTYHRLSLILTLGAMFLVTIEVLRRRRAGFEAGAYLPVVALGIASFLMVVTGVVATHFVLALPLLLLCRPWMNTVAYVYVVVIWTVTTLVPMYGEMAQVLSQVDYPLLAPATNSISEAFVRLYSWDRFITVGVVANICAVIWLAVLTVRPTKFPNVSGAVKA